LLITKNSLKLIETELTFKSSMQDCGRMFIFTKNVSRNANVKEPTCYVAGGLWRPKTRPKFIWLIVSY